MNAFYMFSLSFVFFFGLGCGGDFATDTAGDDEDSDSESDADTDSDADSDADTGMDAAYTVEGTKIILTPWVVTSGSQNLGVFGDGFGTSNGWSEAVMMTAPDPVTGELEIDLRSFGEGRSMRFGLATVTAEGQPDNWLSLRGVAENDPLGLIIEVQECETRKENFCVEILDAEVVAGDCALTYVPPNGCEDEDNDGDTDPDTDPDADGDIDEDEEEDEEEEVPASLVREVCVTHVTGDYDLGYLLMNNPGNTSYWVTDDGTKAVVASPLLTESDADDCATITLNASGEQVKFNGWAAESTYWHAYFVGAGTSGDTCSSSACAVGKVYVDSVVDGAVSSGAEQATVSGYDLVWTD